MLNAGVQGDAARGSDGDDPVLLLSNVTFSWARDEDFSLSVERFALRKGEKLLLMGPSGSGKSSLLSLICGIVQPVSGVVRVLGTDLASLKGGASDRFRADHFGIIFQMFNLLPYASVLDNVLLPLSFSKARQGEAAKVSSARDEALRLLSRLGLPADLMTRKARALSVGQQQRVAVARALIGKPQILIADEPTSSLDRERQEDFLELLLEEIGAVGASLVMVSHDPSLAGHFDRVLHSDEITADRSAAS